jgi:hypothetical protein
MPQKHKNNLVLSYQISELVESFKQARQVETLFEARIIRQFKNCDEMGVPQRTEEFMAPLFQPQN